MTAPPDLLLRIAERRRGQVRAAAPRLRSWPERQILGAAENPFLAALAAPAGCAGPARSEGEPAFRPARSVGEPAFRPARSDGEPAARPAPRLIAEVKMGSPRLGRLQGRVDPLAQARLYAEHGAAAMSVVVEPDFFHGSYELLAACRAASGLPTIAKDFVVDPIQLEWARAAGADAVLLIASLHEQAELARYARQARGLGLAPLIEIHDGEELAKLAADEWELVGVNNRDLRSFEVDLARSMALVPLLPASALKVAESGIHDGLDVALLGDSGFDAVLVGESLLLCADPAAKLRELAAGGRAEED